MCSSGLAAFRVALHGFISFISFFLYILIFFYFSSILSSELSYFLKEFCLALIKFHLIDHKDTAGNDETEVGVPLSVKPFCSPPTSP